MPRSSGRTPETNLPLKRPSNATTTSTPVLLVPADGFTTTKKPRMASKSADPLATFHSAFDPPSSDPVAGPSRSPSKAQTPRRPAPRAGPSGRSPAAATSSRASAVAALPSISSAAGPSRPPASTRKPMPKVPYFVVPTGNYSAAGTTPANLTQPAAPAPPRSVSRPLARRAPPVPLVQSPSSRASTPSGDKPRSAGPRPLPHFLPDSPPKVLKPLRPPPAAAPPPDTRTLKTPRTTALARATDPRTEGGAARLLALALSRRHAGYVPPHVQILQRGLLASPSKSSARGERAHPSAPGLAARFRTHVTRTDGATQLWRAVPTHRPSASAGAPAVSGPLRLRVLACEPPPRAAEGRAAPAPPARAVLATARVDGVDAPRRPAPGPMAGSGSDSDSDGEDSMRAGAGAWVRRGAHVLLVLDAAGAERVRAGARVDVFPPWRVLALPAPAGADGEGPARAHVLGEMPLPSPLGSGNRAPQATPPAPPPPRMAVMCRRFVLSMPEE